MADKNTKCFINAFDALEAKVKDIAGKPPSLQLRGDLVPDESGIVRVTRDSEIDPQGTGYATRANLSDMQDMHKGLVDQMRTLIRDGKDKASRDGYTDEHTAQVLKNIKESIDEYNQDLSKIEEAVSKIHNYTRGHKIPTDDLGQGKMVDTITAEMAQRQLNKATAENTKALEVLDGILKDTKAGYDKSPEDIDIASNWITDAVAGGHTIIRDVMEHARNKGVDINIIEAQRMIFKAFKDGHSDAHPSLNIAAKAFKAWDIEMVKRRKVFNPRSRDLKGHVLPLKIDRNKIGFGEGQINKADMMRYMKDSNNKIDWVRTLGRNNPTDKEIDTFIDNLYRKQTKSISVDKSNLKDITENTRTIRFLDNNADSEFNFLNKFNSFDEEGVMATAFQYRLNSLRKSVFYQEIGSDPEMYRKQLRGYLKRVLPKAQDRLSGGGMRDYVTVNFNHLNSSDVLKGSSEALANSFRGLRAVTNWMLLAKQSVRDLFYDQTFYSAKVRHAMERSTKSKITKHLSGPISTINGASDIFDLVARTAKANTEESKLLRAELKSIGIGDQIEAITITTGMANDLDLSNVNKTKSQGFRDGAKRLESGVQKYTLAQGFLNAAREREAVRAIVLHSDIILNGAKKSDAYKQLYSSFGILAEEEAILKGIASRNLKASTNLFKSLGYKEVAYVHPDDIIKHMTKKDVEKLYNTGRYSNVDEIKQELMTKYRGLLHRTKQIHTTEPELHGQMVGFKTGHVTVDAASQAIQGYTKTMITAGMNMNRADAMASGGNPWAIGFGGKLLGNAREAMGGKIISLRGAEYAANKLAYIGLSGTVVELAKEAANGNWPNDWEKWFEDNWHQILLSSPAFPLLAITSNIVRYGNGNIPTPYTALFNVLSSAGKATWATLTGDEDAEKKRAKAYLQLKRVMPGAEAPIISRLIDDHIVKNISDPIDNKIERIDRDERKGVKPLLPKPISKQ